MTRYDAPLQLDSILRTAPVIPVLTIQRVEDAVPLAEALVEGGLRVLEITLRTGVAAEAIGRIREAVPRAIAGAGTVLDARDLKNARSAGAAFGVSPGLTTELASAIAEDGLPFLPGVATASEIMQARAYGFRHLKFFPADAMGGRAAIDSFAGPFRDVLFCPTGGICEDTLDEYLKRPNVVCAGGSWMAPDTDVNDGAWNAIAERARRISERCQSPRREAVGSGFGD
ncbi:MAG: bifunctional 4-hydroxy-2-oxoglutarate aldolase/2-dehydro-3-deoxy-phosphogluconate aldolase [Rhodospirillales bacterium]|nr:bifunctional 4-hydroxy-2-oxoglutarate aldolase/2-dehydro-3-deoxy-phosphogluconate aldolase [Rhodospirillales bacterium]